MPCRLSSAANPGRIVEMCERYNDRVQRQPGGEKKAEENEN